ncbi:MAG: amidohydrolase [Paraglaciecola sp.]|jgi:amidohydrolase
MNSENSINQLVNLRHNIHQNPELSGVEYETAKLVAKKLALLRPDTLLSNIGGCGVAAKFDGIEDGPCILFRAELDALPINETNDFSYRSKKTGVSHKCGHDGHMAIICGLGEMVAQNRPSRGSVILLFQPAEETGNGARAVVADKAFAKLKPDYCYALHNLPGYPMGEVLIRAGTFNCASRGMIIKLTGKTAHAAYPETGNSPAPALAELLQIFPHMASTLNKNELLMTTTVHASMGEKACGTAPSDAILMVTLRSETNEGMDLLADKAQTEVNRVINQYDLQSDISWTDIFDASVNDEQCVKQIERAALKTNHQVTWLDDPFRWSEDFGAISASATGAMFGYGAGETNPQIHNPDYDFPDELIRSGLSIFFEIYKEHLLNTPISI